MKKHMGWENAKDDYAVMDGEKTVGRTYRERAESVAVVRKHVALSCSSSELAKSLEEAKQQFKERYEEMKAQGVRTFSDC